MEETDHNFRTTTADIWRRPQTEELVDVHVYLVPSEKWIDERQLAQRDVINHSVSSGFVRVLPSTTLLDLRNDISEQLGTENVPETFVFLRSVGRNFTQVKPKQELDLKVKSFLPPYAEEPELYVKEGNYTLRRSASLGPEVPQSREASLLIPNSRVVSGESSADFPTSSESNRPSLTESNSDTPPEQEVKRTKSLDRKELRFSMASRRAVAPVLTQRQQYVGQRRSYISRRVRPPTPRVKETPISELPQSRSKSIASVKTEEPISESPTEQLEENETHNKNLAVEDEESRIAINSPPPWPSTASNGEEKDVRIPVPTPTLTPVKKGKEESEVSNNKFENEISLEAVNIKDEGAAAHFTDTNNPSGEKEQSWKSENNDTSSSYKEDNDNTLDRIESDSDDKYLETGSVPQEQNLEQSQLSFENIHTKMGDEDVIVDPIKLLEGEGESLKNTDENGRDHYDEGFHSGELVNSEEDSNSIETLGSSGVKEEELVKPTRTATPMPRSNSFYKSVKMDPEIQNLQAMFEDMKAERRLRELKRDALLHKVRDLQRRKASSKDQAREEWRRRYFEMKKSTPRLEDHCSKLRQELEKLIKDMLVSVKTHPDSKPHKPSKKTSYKIMIMRLLQEVEDLRRRLQSVAVKLNAETKLRSQAEFEVKKLREDLLHKKTQVTLTRKQASFPQTTEQFFISAV